MPDGGSPRAIVVRDLRVLVTAGASGIGRVVAEAFASVGAKVHITDIDEAAVVDAVSQIPGLAGTAGDASSPKDADRAVADVRARFAGLDVLVNNVGVAGPTGRIKEAEDVASLAMFLCSDLARNVTGQAISVDGNVEYL